MTSPGNQSSPRGAIVSVQIQGSDPDGQALSWSAAGLPPGLSINTTTGLIAGTVSLSSATSYNVTVTAKDSQNLGSPVSFTWTTTLSSTGGSGVLGEYFEGLTPGNAAPWESVILPLI